MPFLQNTQHPLAYNLPSMCAAHVPQIIHFKKNLAFSALFLPKLQLMSVLFCFFKYFDVSVCLFDFMQMFSIFQFLMFSRPLIFKESPFLLDPTFGNLCGTHQPKKKRLSAPTQGNIPKSKFFIITDYIF